MKKVLTILLAALVMMTIVPLAAFPAAADDVVVYVKDKGTGDGSSPENALSTLGEAYAVIGDNNGTIVLVGTVYHYELFEAPAHKGTVTITGVYNGVDYKGVYSCLTLEHFLCGGDTVFKNMTLNLMTTLVIRARFHHLTFGEGFQTTSDNFADLVPQLYVVGGDQGGESLEDTSQDTHITIKSGSFIEVIGGMRGGAPSDYTGHMLVEVGGKDTIIQKITLGSRGVAHETQTGTLVLDGGVIHNFTCANANKAAGFFHDKVEVILTKNFKFDGCYELAGARINGEGVFQGLSGASCWYATYPDSMLADTVLKIDNATFDAINSTEMYDETNNPNGKILAASFTSVEKADNSSYEMTYAEPETGTPYQGGAEETKPAETKPVEETKPADTKPAETKPAETKPADTKPADTKAATGTDAATKPVDQTANKGGIPAYVWAIVAVVVVAAVAGIVVATKKKKN